MTYIGFNYAKKGKSKGKRVRTPHYVGKDLREATLNAILIDQRWDKVVTEAAAKAKIAEPVVGKARLKPVWPTVEQERIQSADREELESMGYVVNLPDEEESESYLSIEQLKDKFLVAQKARIGLMGRRGLKEGTQRTMGIWLKRALMGIDTSLNVLHLKRDDVRRFVDYWLSPERKVAERTAGNYCKMFKRMIDWADNEEVCGFRKPKINDLFCFANTRGHIEKFDPERMKMLLAAATERCRMYILLGLNTGYNQIDIANLRKDEIVCQGEDMFMVRRREKTSHQNDFSTMHFLWPETWALMKKHMAQDNAENLAFLNVNGKKLKRGKTDNIRDSINEVRDASGVTEVTYKQLRKMGITAIKRITMNPDIARIYASQKIAGVLGHYDRDDFFDPLTAALKKWRDELIQLGVL